MAIILPQDYKHKPPDFKTVGGRVNAEDLAFHFIRKILHMLSNFSDYLTA